MFGSLLGSRGQRVAALQDLPAWVEASKGPRAQGRLGWRLTQRRSHAVLGSDALREGLLVRLWL